MNMGSPLPEQSNDQWMDIIQYLDVDGFKSLRLAGNKAMCLSDPALTSHLQLRMDKVPFFCENDCVFSEQFIRQWLENRTRLVINDVHAKMSPSRVTYLIENGFLDSVSEVVVYDCHYHRTMVEVISRLPTIRALTLIDAGDQGESTSELEAIIFQVGNMPSLTTLDIEFDSVLHGSRLSFLLALQDLQHLRLLGFDLSEGINYLSHLKDLETLRLCHGNFYSSPNNDVNEKDLTDLINLKKLQRLHLEGFDCLQGYGLGAFVANGSIQHLVLKHCQEMNDECLSYIGRMTGLASLHFVLSECDDFDVFSIESLQNLNSLATLKSLSLFRVLGSVSDLRVLPGLCSLETLNVAFDEPMDDEEEVEDICTTALSVFPSLQKMRSFSEDCMEHSFDFGGLTVEYSEFSFGDCVYLD